MLRRHGDLADCVAVIVSDDDNHARSFGFSANVAAIVSAACIASRCAGKPPEKNARVVFLVSGMSAPVLPQAGAQAGLSATGAWIRIAVGYGEKAYAELRHSAS